MRVSSVRAFRIAAVLGFLGVTLGAFGAHGLREVFAQRPHAQSFWEKAVLYHFVHVILMLILACLQPFRVMPWALFGAGIVFFSGSLYLLALTGLPAFGATAPIGGGCFLAGWLWLAFDRKIVVGVPDLRR